MWSVQKVNYLKPAGIQKLSSWSSPGCMNTVKKPLSEQKSQQTIHVSENVGGIRQLSSSTVLSSWPTSPLYTKDVKLLTPSLSLRTTHDAKFQNDSKSESRGTQSTVSETKQGKDGVPSVHISTSDLDSTVLEGLQKIREQDFSEIPNPNALTHFKHTHEKEKEKRAKESESKVKNHTSTLPHPIWSVDEVDSVEVTHKKPEKIVDRMAYYAVKALRFNFDLFSGYLFLKRTERIWLIRVSFLETVAGVPGMVAAMTRHLHSLRRMRRDHGWIHTLLEEAENERMHLMTALQLLQPSFLFRSAVVISQGIMVTFFSLAYLISPRFCHRFVGYLEEEAVVTYTKLLKDIESGTMQHWKTQAAPEIAITYWQLSKDATMKDVIFAIRADEAHHRVVNHTLASMQTDDYNPYKPGE